MSDTQRTKAALAALFPDNSTGVITPQNLRDFLESTAPSYGALHYADNVTATSVVTPGTYLKAATASILDASNRFSSPVNNQLHYDGVVGVTFRVNGVFSITSAATAQVLGFELVKNGTVEILQSRVRQKTGTAGDVQAISLHAMVSLVPGDYLELWLTDETSAAQVTVNHGYLSVAGWLT